MSQPPSLSSMSKTPSVTKSFSNFRLVFDEALQAYQKKTEQDLTAHPLTTKLQACDSPADILTLLQDQVDQFEKSRSGDERLQKWLSPTINVLYAFSAVLGEGIGLVFSPAKAIFAGVGVLLLAAKDVEASQDTLMDIFERIENFFRRLEVYTNVPPTPAMSEMMVKIMVQVLDILGTATKEMKMSRTKKFLKKVAGIAKLEDGLEKLDKMINEEARMANAEVLKVTHNIDEKVEGVKGTMQMIIDDGRKAATKVEIVMQRTTHKVDDMMRRQLRESLRKWQSPSDPSTNHNIACECQHEETTEWFCTGDVFGKWKETGSLLWIHGNPGSGKSVLCSAIINDVETLHKAGLASMAYFYFDFRDIDKQSRRNLLPSLLIQLSASSDPFCDILSKLYKEHDDGMRQPSDGALMHCLKKMLTLPDQGRVYLIMDALDECPNTSGIPSARERVLDLVRNLVGLQLPSLHICVTSRPEVDIMYALERLALFSVSLHNESGQKKDIEEYIKSVVYSPSATLMKKWRDDDKDLVIKTLSERADGMFRWVYCQLETLRHCLPQNVPRVLSQLPGCLDETYKHVLNEIGKTNQSYAYRMLQCLTVAIRPLRVEELAEILVLDFDDAKDGIPELRENWRWKDQQEAVLSTCSSLITVVNYGPHRVVQFSHSAVKEFLTSDRLASSSGDVSQFHILLEPAHTVIAKACLGVLLQSDNGVRNPRALNSSPLAGYAARYWANHARFESVSTHVRDAIRCLFDPEKPYFEAWLGLYDVDKTWDDFASYNEHERRGSPLYYASLCGFRDLAAHLIATHPHHVNARLGRRLSPLVAALHNRHFDIAELLYRRGADLGVKGYRDRTPLHAASVNGSVEIAQWLLARVADANQRDDHRETPLHLAAKNGRFEFVQMLLRHSVFVDAKNKDDRTSLHLASESGHVEIVGLLLLLLLQQHVAKAATQNNNMGHPTPLHLASTLDDSHFAASHEGESNSNVETDQVLLKHGADVTTRDVAHPTPVHLASSSGSAEAVQLLIEHGAGVTT